MNMTSKSSEEQNGPQKQHKPHRNHIKKAQKANPQAPKSKMPNSVYPRRIAPPTYIIYLRI